MSVEAATCSHQDETRKGVSSTAHGVAAFRALESKRDPSIRLFHDPYASALAGKVGQERIERQDSFSGWFAERCAARTKKIDDEVSKAINSDGFKQICTLGAGLDSRAWRLQKTVEHSVRYIEVDFQEIFDFKLSVLKSEGAVSPFDYRSVVADLSLDTWPDVLITGGFDPTIPTLWLMEGFINYLTEEEAAVLVDRLGSLSPAGSRIVVTSVTARTPRRPEALHRFYPEDALGFFTSHGWGGVQTEMDELARGYGREILDATPHGYYLLVLENSSNK